MSTPLPEITAGVRACVFTVGNETFAVDVRHAREVVVFEDSTTVPLAPAQVAGVANLRGDVIAIVDARPLLGQAARRAGRGLCGLVLVADGAEVALVVDEVLGLETFDGVTAFADTGQRRFCTCALGLLDRGGRPVTLLDADKMVAALRPRPGGARQGA